MSQENLTTLLSLEECKVILDKYYQETSKNYEVQTYNIKSATEAKGFLGEYFHLTIECLEKHREENEVGLLDDYVLFDQNI